MNNILEIQFRQSFQMFLLYFYDSDLEKKFQIYLNEKE